MGIYSRVHVDIKLPGMVEYCVYCLEETTNRADIIPWSLLLLQSGRSSQPPVSDNMCPTLGRPQSLGGGGELAISL